MEEWPPDSADGGVYNLRTPRRKWEVTQTDVTDPRGNHRIVGFGSSGYDHDRYEELLLGFDYCRRQAGTNVITSVTDQRTQNGVPPTTMGNVTSITRLEAPLSGHDHLYLRTGPSTSDQCNRPPWPFRLDRLRQQGQRDDDHDQLGNTYSLSYNLAGQPTASPTR